MLGAYYGDERPDELLVKVLKSVGVHQNQSIAICEDRIAQMVAKIYLELKVEKIFYEDSYGYKPNKSAIQVIGMLRKRCRRKDCELILISKDYLII